MSNSSYVLFVLVPAVCLSMFPWVFPLCVCSLAYMTELHLCFYSLIQTPSPLGAKASESIVWVLHLMLGDWWCEGDLLVMSEEQAAGGKLFCPCLLRARLLFFILFFLFQHSLLLCVNVALQCPFRSGCEVACSKQCYFSDILPSYSYESVIL